jgi:hypothetical protein
MAHIRVSRRVSQEGRGYWIDLSVKRGASRGLKEIARGKSHPKKREFVMWLQIGTGILQPTFIGPARVLVTVNNRFRSFPGSKS